MTNLSWGKRAGAVFVLCGAMVIVSPAQVFTTLVTFNGDNGAQPEDTLVQGADGSLYGTTLSGGSHSCVYYQVCGTVFRVTPSGGLKTVLVNDGEDPVAGLALGTDGDYYGTTYFGGENSPPCDNNGCGTVFKVTSSGTQTPLHNFDSTDGANPSFGLLIQAADGSFYGATEVGGTGTCTPPLGEGCGTIFKITPGGTLITLHSFVGTDGAYPEGSLVQGTDGNFYGTTTGGSECSEGCGTVFKITSDGTLATLHVFDSTDGAFPHNTLVRATDGNLYGITAVGGNNVGTCGDNGCGTLFRITPLGTLTTIYSFCSLTSCADGYSPEGLIQASDGNFYGATGGGGSNDIGTVFQVSSGGVLTTLHDFDYSDGSYPYAGPIQATDGSFYGTTTYGGRDDCHIGCGTAYKLSTGLGPFVSFVRNPAKAGQAFGILGQGFTGTTSVSLNGTPASFTVVSDTYIRATVPASATTGYVTVTTPSGTLTSNVPFHVIK